MDRDVVTPICNLFIQGMVCTTYTNLYFVAYTVTKSKPLSNKWTYVGKTKSLRYNFGMLEVVDGMFLLGGLSPISLHEETANEVCTIIDTDRVECEIVGGKSELGLIGYLGQKHNLNFSVLF